MLKQFVYVLLVVLGFVISLVGCGTENSGSILLSPPTNINGVVTTTATYTPSSGSVLPNQKITFYWRTVGQTSNISVDYPPSDSYSDSTGRARSELTLPSPRSEALSVYVRAGTGDLTSGSLFVNVSP